MKKTLLALMLPCALLSAKAQEYLHVTTYWDGYGIIPVEQIDSITFGETSLELLPELMAKDDNIKLFNEALQLTGLCDSLMGVYDNDFYYENSIVQGIYSNQQCYALQKLRKGYTAFVETDAVYAAHGIHTIADLKAYAAEVYDEMYPEDAAVSDPTDRRNSLNRFVAYHLLDRKGTRSNLTAAGIENERAGYVRATYTANVDIADWYETMMPHSLLKCSTPAWHSAVFVNRRGRGNEPDDRGVLIEGAEIVNEAGGDCQGEAFNGYYHYINDIIAYDKQTQEVVLDEQIIVNNSTLSPELMNNGMRCSTPFTPALSNDEEVFLPKGALKNVQFNSEGTRMYYLFSENWHNMQTDEMMILGLFDVTIKLPPLPAGTYELNMGYSAGMQRHVVACWFDGEFVDTIDCRITGDNPSLGWMSDEYLETPEAIAENDRLLFERGYRKGLDYCYISGSSQIQRESELCLRRIITTFTTDGKSDHYLRFKNAMDYDDGFQEFMMDYLELCPTHLLKEYE